MKPLLFVLLLVFSATNDALAHGMADLQTKTEYLIGVEDVSFYPYFDFRNGDDQGYLKALLEAFGRHSKIHFRYISLPISRFEKWYQLDRIDFRLPDNPNWHRGPKQQLIFSQPLTHLTTATIVLAKNHGIALDEFRTIGIISGFTPSLHWQKQMQQGAIRIREDASTAILYRMLLSGMVDGLDIPMSVIRHQSATLGHRDDLITSAASIPAGVTSYSLSTEAYPEVISAFNQFLQAHAETVEDLKRRYGID